MGKTSREIRGSILLLSSKFLIVKGSVAALKD